MRRIALLAGLLAVCAGPAAEAKSPLDVSPRSAGPRSDVAVRARVAADPLVYPGDRYVLVLSAPARRGCSKDGFKWYPDGGDSRRIVFRVDAPRGGWCRGLHRMRLKLVRFLDTTESVCDNGPESGSSQCESGDLVNATRTLAHAAFRVV